MCTNINRDNLPVIGVLPSLKVGGGVSFALRFFKELDANSKIIVLWRTENEEPVSKSKSVYLCKFNAKRSTALLSYFSIVFNFLVYLVRPASNKHECLWVFTHFSTYPLALFVPRERLIFLIQGIEWEFVKSRLMSAIILKICKALYRNRTVLVSNTYLEKRLLENGVCVNSVVKMWASDLFLNYQDVSRVYDLAMVVRTASIKRYDLYKLFITRAIKQGVNWNFVVITPENSVKEYFKQIGVTVLFCPSIPEMSRIYSMSKFFLLLSDHEGFGLPPLEAMGSGCTPIARDCGGVRAYMNGQLEENIIPLDSTIQDIFNLVSLKLLNYDPILSPKLARSIFVRGKDG